MKKELIKNNGKNKCKPQIKTNKALNLILIFIITGCMNNESIVMDIEGNSYKIKKYENVWWMTENVRTTKDENGREISYFIPNNDESNMKKYGLLYDYETACKVCPKGWELPNNTDWDNLINGEKNNMKSNKFKDVEYWGEEIGIEQNGFSIRPAGYGNNGDHPNTFKEKSIVWSRSSSEEFGWTVVFEKGKNKIRKVEQHKVYGFSVRCIKK